MSLRDQMAKEVLNGLVSTLVVTDLLGSTTKQIEQHAAGITKISYIYADAMLKERDKP